MTRKDLLDTAPATADQPLPDHRRPTIGRRGFVGAAAASGIALAGASRVFAQDSTPAPATPESQGNTPDRNSTSDTDRFPAAKPVGPAIPPEYGTPTNWTSEGYDLKSTRNVQGSSITSQNVTQLGQAWMYPIQVSATFGSLVANPTVVDGVVYVQDANSNVYAVDLASGQKVWTNTYDQPVPSGGPNGTAAAYGNVYFALGGTGLVVGVDGKTGAEKWRTSVLGFRQEGITMPPLVYDNTLYISNIPGTAKAFYNGGQRGTLFAMDASTGQILWYFDTTQDNLWGNARVNSGGGLWHTPSFDDNGEMYVGIGNASPYPGVQQFPAGSSRPGDNDYSDSLLKINPATGGVDWYINLKPHDLFDLDNHLSPILGTVNYNGTDTPVVFTSGKHGLVAAVDRASGQEIWRTPVGKHQNDNLQQFPSDGSTVEVFPGTLGGVETPLAAANGMVYAPIFNMASVYNGSSLDAASIDISKATGQLVALKADNGSIVWDVEIPSGQLAGATVVNDVVFTAGLDGVVRAYGASDGTPLWTWQVSAGVNAPLAVSGDYLLVPAGGPLIPSSDTASPAPQAASGLAALKVGAGGATATPTA